MIQCIKTTQRGSQSEHKRKQTDIIAGVIEVKVGHSKVLIWQNDFTGLKCENPEICGKQQIDPQTCMYCDNAKKIPGKLGI